MKPTRLPLTVVPGAHCLVALPLSLHAVEPPAVLEITLAAEGSSALLFYAGWGGAASASHSIEVPAALAQVHRLRPPVQLSVRTVVLPTATALWVCPESAADWEMAHRHAEHLRDAVLRQVFAAAIGQRLPLWAHGSECVWVRVERAEPAGHAAVRLAAGMDLIISPPPSIATNKPAAPPPPPAHRRSRRLRIVSGGGDDGQPPALSALPRAALTTALALPSMPMPMPSALAPTTALPSMPMPMPPALAPTTAPAAREPWHGKSSQVKLHELRSSLSVGLCAATMRALGATPGHLVHLSVHRHGVGGVGGAAAVAEERQGTSRRAAPPGHAFGIACLIGTEAAPVGHVRLHACMRRLLGRAEASVISVRALGGPASHLLPLNSRPRSLHASAHHGATHASAHLGAPRAFVCEGRLCVRQPTSLTLSPIDEQSAAALAGSDAATASAAAANAGAADSDKGTDAGAAGAMARAALDQWLRQLASSNDEWRRQAVEAAASVEAAAASAAAAAAALPNPSAPEPVFVDEPGPIDEPVPMPQGAVVSLGGVGLVQLFWEDGSGGNGDGGSGGGGGSGSGSGSGSTSSSGDGGSASAARSLFLIRPDWCLHASHGPCLACMCSPRRPFPTGACMHLIRSPLVLARRGSLPRPSCSPTPATVAWAAQAAAASALAALAARALRWASAQAAHRRPAA
jgi:uncharacterized membrane protein YgcG